MIEFIVSLIALVLLIYFFVLMNRIVKQLGIINETLKRIERNQYSDKPKTITAVSQAPAIKWSD